MITFLKKRLSTNSCKIIALNIFCLITLHCNDTRVNKLQFVPEIPTSGPAKGLHGLDSHSGISVAAVINVHECQSCVITARTRSPELSVSFVRFPAGVSLA